MERNIDCDLGRQNLSRSIWEQSETWHEIQAHTDLPLGGRM
jgi:hypothetical protein